MTSKVQLDEGVEAQKTTTTSRAEPAFEVFRSPYWKTNCTRCLWQPLDVSKSGLTKRARCIWQLQQVLASFVRGRKTTVLDYTHSLRFLIHHRGSRRRPWSGAEREAAGWFCAFHPRYSRNADATLLHPPDDLISRPAFVSLAEIENLKFSLAPDPHLGSVFRLFLNVPQWQVVFGGTLSPLLVPSFPVSVGGEEDFPSEQVAVACFWIAPGVLWIN